jgi:hypothetical protein
VLNWKHCFQNRRLNLKFSLKNVPYLGRSFCQTPPGDHYTGADPKGGGVRAPPKIGKNMIFLAQNRDFSNEIPQKFSRLPPQWEKIRLFGVKS